MQKRLSVFVCFILIFVLIIFGCSNENLKRSGSNSVQKNKHFYKVVRTIDGDTIVVKIGRKSEKVRLIGVNTPEIHHPTKGVEYFGPEAALYTKKLLEGKTVRLKYDVQKRDRYRRLLAYVYLPDGTFVNAKLVAEGYAQVMTVPPNVKYAERFIQLQREAREKNIGLWQK